MPVTLSDDFYHWQQQRRATLCHRQLLVISGDQAWVKQAIFECLNENEIESALWVGNFSSTDNCNNKCTNKNFQQFLGQEFSHLVYDGFAGVRASSLYALSGTVKCNGLMILLCPDLQEWMYMDDPEANERSSFGVDNCKQKSFFIEWLSRAFLNSLDVCILSRTGFHGTVAAMPHPLPRSSPKPGHNIATSDQQKIIQLVADKFSQSDNFQVVLAADRGRGKSSCLGFLLAQRAQQRPISALVTASKPIMLDKVFEHFCLSTGASRPQKTSVSYNHSVIQFKPVDALLLAPSACDILLIDEAATLPTSILAGLLETYPRVIMCTTIQGYEGSGRGFSIRLMPMLRERYPQFTFCSLQQPVRWFDGDTLEAFWDRVMLMDKGQSYQQQIAQFDHLPQQPKQKSDSITHQILSSQYLLDNPTCFSTVFGLLVAAHYQTSPDDIARMLDATELEVHVLMDSQQQIRAVALLQTEGNPDIAELATHIAKGKRRVKGNLTPQKLAYNYNQPQLAKSKYLRVVRIAVMHQHRRQGLGKVLMNKVVQRARELNVDFVSASFGVTNMLLRFWAKLNFAVVSLGIKRDASSGEHSAIVICAINDNAHQQLQQLKGWFKEYFVFHQVRRLKELDKQVIESILQGFDVHTDTSWNSANSILQKETLEDFIQGYRPLHASEVSIAKLLKEAEPQSESGKRAYRFLTSVVAADSDHQYLCDKYHLSGKKHIEQLARKCCAELLGIVIPVAEGESQTDFYLTPYSHKKRG